MLDGANLINLRKHRIGRCMIQQIYGLVMIFKKSKVTNYRKPIYGHLDFLAKM